jgi:hypothetical protein
MAKQRRKAPSQSSDCPRCCGGREVYIYWKNQYEFDVDRARDFVKDGRKPVEVEDESVATAVDRSDIVKAHIDHVNPAIPGIISYLYYRTESGEQITAQMLIDGHHRAARCLRDRLPFFAYLLSEEESRSIIVRSPDKPGPSLLDEPANTE